jgi:hypothetical protein
MIVWRPEALILKTLPVKPKEDLPRSASRYCVTDSSLSHSMYRSFMKWSYCKDRNTLSCDFLGVRAVPELGGRNCIVLRRTCNPDELDNFCLDDPTVRDPATDPAQAIHEVTLYIDVATWLQVGSVLKRADGELVGSYFFRDVELNPTFPPGTFTPDGFKK